MGKTSSGVRSDRWITALVFLLITSIVLTMGYVVIYVPRGESTSTTSSTSLTTSSLTTPKNVTVFGLISTTGKGTNDIYVLFTSNTTAKHYWAYAGNGHFQISVPNFDVYIVTTVWHGSYPWQAGVIDRGTFTTYATAGSKGWQSFNIIDETPNSELNYSGMVQRNSSQHSLVVRFNATNGLSLSSPLLQDGKYSILLPNMMHYLVSLEWTGPNNTTLHCIAAEIEANHGLGVQNQTLNLAC